MDTCQMTGCHDIAGYALDYSYKGKKETIDICKSCARFWRECFLDEDETAIVRAFSDEATAAAK